MKRLRLALIAALAAALAAPAPADAGASLVRRIETWTSNGLRIENPSAIAVEPKSGALLIADAEIETSPRFRQENLWELRLDPIELVRAVDLTSVTLEPTGLLVHPVRKTLFVTDDDEVALYELGLDGRLLATVSLLPLGARDPEGVAGTADGTRLFVADGRARQVLELTPSGALVSSFDLKRHGIRDAEGIAYDPRTDHLFVVSARPVALFELTRAGELVDAFDLRVFGAMRPQGVALASSEPLRVYIVDELHDEDPDGRLFELALVARPPGARVVTHLVGDVDGFGFRGDEAGFARVDADRDGLLEPGEQLPPSASLPGSSLDNRGPADPPATDAVHVLDAGAGARLRFEHTLPADSLQGGATWGRLTLVVGDARALAGARTQVYADGHLVGEILGTSGRELRAGSIAATVIELPPAVLAALADGRLEVELAREPGAGADDVMLDYARLEVALGGTAP